MIGAPMQKSMGPGDKLFPLCSGPECWCLDCVMDNIVCDEHVFEKWSHCDERAFSYATKALKKYYIKCAEKND